MAFKFENLDVWKKALDLSFDIHQITKKFPKEEMYVLSSQMRRAADSIALNIAEGSTGQSNSIFKQFINYAIRSGIEIIACLYIAKRRLLIMEDSFKSLYAKTEEITRMLFGLRKSLR